MNRERKDRAAELPATADGEVGGEAAGAVGQGTEPAMVEIGGRSGLDPVRFGDWEKNGRCIDF